MFLIGNVTGIDNSSSPPTIPRCTLTTRLSKRAGTMYVTTFETVCCVCSTSEPTSMLQISSPNPSPAKSSPNSVTSSWVATSAGTPLYSTLSPSTLDSVLGRTQLSYDDDPICLLCTSFETTCSFESRRGGVPKVVLTEGIL